MSKFNMFGLRRVVGVGAITAVAAIGLASLGAGNAAAAELPSGSKVTEGVDGIVVEISRTNEVAYPVPSQANNGAGRAAEVSGLVTVNAGEASGTLTTGYIVGCQINIDGLEGALTGSADIGGTVGLSGSLTVPLTPGEVTFVEIGSKEFEGGMASIQYERQGIDVQLCGGYAQARAYSIVQTTGNYVVKSTLYGAPFSIN